ncbi:MAG: glycosyl hydrolase [Anaerolineae bacterium]|nr:glycosyl hydrolase [Anaerolineae bacterium]MDW8300083.1 glycosyl hydrolase [Anaerolineae bacterium]
MTHAVEVWAYRAGRAARWLWDRRGIWLRGAFLTLILLNLAPARQRILPEPAQSVQTEHPILCMHTRLVDEVEDIKIWRTLRMVREMGAPAIVEFFPWAYIQPRRDTYDWHHPDRIIRMARQQGLRIIARLGVVPAWARPDPRLQPTSLNYLPPERYADYARFVAAFAARYRGEVTHIIPWNEPNLYFEWGFRRVSPEEYVQFLKLVYEAAHEANPEVQILGAALAPTLEPEDGANGMSDLIYLRRMYQAGGGAYFDALAVHTYGFTAPPDEPPSPERLNFRRFELLLEIMREFGDGEKPVYITETSWNDHPRWVNAVRPSQRIAYTLRALRYAESAWRTVRHLCFWFFRAPTLYRNYMDGYAFVTVEFRPRPIYEEVQRWARGWDSTP